MESKVAVGEKRAFEMLPVATQALATTDSDVDAVIEPIVAEIVPEPCDTPVAKPVVAPTVTTAALPEDQVAISVTAAVDPSENVPVAVSCLVVPIPVKAGLGVIAIDCTMAAVTFRVVLPDTDWSVAIIDVDPAATDVASPLAALIVANADVPELQVALFVISAVLLSEYVPVALNCFVRPIGTLVSLGVTEMDSSCLPPGEPPPHAETARVIAIRSAPIMKVASRFVPTFDLRLSFR